MISIESRVDRLTELSQAAYGSGLKREATGEEKAQRIVRVGTHIVAQALEDGYGDGLVAGEYLQRYVFSKLDLGGAMDAWPDYKSILAGFPPVRLPARYDQSLDELAVSFANTTRKTVNRDGSAETVAMHTVNMLVTALTYAAENYPDLDTSRLAIGILLHDLPEGHSGDVSSLAIQPDQQANKVKREAAALRRIELEQGRNFPRLVSRLLSQERLDSEESRYGKSFDKLDPKFNTLFTRGTSLTEHHNLTAEQYIAAMTKELDAMQATYGRDHPDIQRMHRVLVEQIVDETDWTRAAKPPEAV